jgi:hypothetical protein
MILRAAWVQYPVVSSVTRRRAFHSGIDARLPADARMRTFGPSGAAFVAVLRAIAQRAAPAMICVRLGCGICCLLLSPCVPDGVRRLRT